MGFLTDDDPAEWIIFYHTTREYVVFLLMFISLYLSSYFIICVFRKRVHFYADCYEDAVVYRVSIWISTFSLSVSLGAALLLPISIISNEVLLLYPNSYYVQWLNASLIQGLWSHVFLFSNVALFILLPFSHLFIESEGFPGSSRGIMARVHETVLVLGLLALLIFGIIFIIAAMFDNEQNSIESAFNISSYHLPFLYSCVSFLGVLMLLLCTPVGFARLFSVMADILVKDKVSSQEINYVESDSDYDEYEENSGNEVAAVYYCRHLVRRKVRFKKVCCGNESENDLDALKFDMCDEDDQERSKFSIASIRRNCLYPAVMLLLLLLTILSLLMVSQNTLQLCFGIKSLPIYSQNLPLGISSLSAIGPVGALLEIILILYLWCTSVVGLYSLPVFCHLKPKVHCTSMTQVIGNCAVLLVLSSALPVLARSLGITNFDLLGNFGRIKWLGNFYIVLFHNIMFTVTVAICLGTKITGSVRREIYERLFSFSGSSRVRSPSVLRS